MDGFACPHLGSDPVYGHLEAQAPPDAARRFNMHVRMLQGALLVSLEWSYCCVDCFDVDHSHPQSTGTGRVKTAKRKPATTSAGENRSDPTN